MKSSVVVLLNVAVVMILLHNAAMASCGAATCPLNTFHAMNAGMLSLGIRHEYINQDRLYYGSSLSFVGAVPEHHDELQTINDRTEISAGYGFNDWFALQVMVPLIHREHSHISHETSTPMVESWNFTGLGDMVLSGQFALLTPQDEFGPSLSTSLGVKLPTGVTDFKNGDGEQAEVTIQPGTGSVDALLELNFRQAVLSVPTFDGQFSALPLIVGVGYQASGRGTDDYRFGNTFHLHLGTAYQFVPAASLLFQVNGRFQDYADVGTTGEPRENTGGAWIYASPGVQLQLAGTVALSGFIQLPLYEDVHGLQQTAPFNLEFGVSFSPNIL